MLYADKMYGDLETMVETDLNVYSDIYSFQGFKMTLIKNFWRTKGVDPDNDNFISTNEALTIL